MQSFQDQSLFTVWSTLPWQSDCKREVSFNLSPLFYYFFFSGGRKSPFHFLLLTNFPLISLSSGRVVISFFTWQMDINTIFCEFQVQDYLFLSCSKITDGHLKWEWEGDLSRAGCLTSLFPCVIRQVLPQQGNILNEPEIWRNKYLKDL